MNDCEFIRVVTKENEECFLLTKLKNGGQEGFDLTLCCDGTVWTGSVSADDLDTLCSRLKIQFNKYVKETLKALTNNGESKHSFQYELKRSKDSAQFSWKKHVEDENITFQLGSAMLKSRVDSPQMITQIYNHCIENIGELKTRIHNLETDNQRLSQERINALKRLEKCVVAKEELENDLYSKFSLVLNSKKEKIRQLKEQDSEKIVTGVKRQQTETQESKVHTSDSGENTDEEDIPKSKRSRVENPKKRASGGDDSLILDNDDESGVSVTRTRRQRGRQQKKQTPAKPVLPRVGSGETTPGSERKSRLRKTGSSTSNKSSENIDADDLLGDL
ncbi:DNA repair protein XRCC4-like isoform X2 [Ruditapes philippinarum]|uniref:DNA repair protein XRCC4-like isoform X2 n=1 Tax=Ruditapes philippinarum TaxID=129788 RepID=UPI00295B45A6|nr:DNA repair protein XRCC4-like isoform X2 [Ruditapes philippinarum]